MSQNEVDQLLKEHQKWLDSKGESGVRADLRGRDLTWLEFSGTSFKGALLDRAQLDNAECLSANFVGAKMRGASLIKCRLLGANFTGANLGNTKFSGAKLSGSYLTGARMSWADFRSCVMHRTSIAGGNLEHANLSKTNLNKADLQDTRLNSANFYKSNLEEANLTGADLSRAFLSEANLGRAKITGAVLSQTITEGWAIPGIVCDYIYFDSNKQLRTPRDRNFEPGEFEEFYSWFPSFVYYFKDEMHALDPYLISLIIQGLNESVDSLHLRVEEFRGRGLYPQIKISAMGSESIEVVEDRVTSLLDFGLREIRSTIENSEAQIELVVKEALLNVTRGLTVSNFNFHAPVQTVIGENYGKIILNSSERQELNNLVSEVKNVEDNNKLTTIAKETAVKELTKILAGETEKVASTTADWLREVFGDQLNTLSESVKAVLGI